MAVCLSQSEGSVLQSLGPAALQVVLEPSGIQTIAGLSAIGHRRRARESRPTGLVWRLTRRVVVSGVRCKYQKTHSHSAMRQCDVMMGSWRVRVLASDATRIGFVPISNIMSTTSEMTDTTMTGTKRLSCPVSLHLAAFAINLAVGDLRSLSHSIWRQLDHGMAVPGSAHVA
jgi:hypothetical protein